MVKCIVFEGISRLCTIMLLEKSRIQAHNCADLNNKQINDPIPNVIIPQ